MPKITRSATKQKLENGSSQAKGAKKHSPEKKKATASSTRKPKRAGTPSRAVKSSPALAKHNGQPGVNAQGSGASVAAATPKAVPPPEEKIVGARMSGVKHSGLLAKDEEMRSLLQGEQEQEDFDSVRMELFTTPEQHTPGTITGKDIYTFHHRPRSSTAARQLQTPKNSKEAQKISSPEKSPDETPLPKKRKVGQSSKTTVLEHKGGRSSVAHKEKMEVGKKESEVKVKRVTRSSRRLASDSDADSADLSDEEEEDEEMIRLAAKLNRGAAVCDEMDEDTLEDYFTAHSGKTGATSDHTLAKLACPRMDQQSVQSALSAAPSDFQSDCQALYDEYKHLYPYWLFQMSNGYNILLYGLGSKQKLLEDFRTENLSDTCHLVVNGFFPGLTIKQVLTKLSAELLNHTGTFKSLLEHAQFISKTLDSTGSRRRSRKASDIPTNLPSEIFLIIHNIDGPMLRGDTAQTVLSTLAKCSHISVLASVDHINSALLWDHKKISRFSWLYHDVTTFERYTSETSYENSLLIRQSGNLALSSLTHVTKSLTPNARGIFELLVRYQLEHKSSTEGVYLGMSFHDAYTKCREKFLVNSDLTLRAQLTEFVDHKLVQSRRGPDGVEYLFVPVEDGALEEFLEQQD